MFFGLCWRMFFGLCWRFRKPEPEDQNPNNKMEGNIEYTFVTKGNKEVKKMINRQNKLIKKQNKLMLKNNENKMIIDNRDSKITELENIIEKITEENGKITELEKIIEKITSENGLLLSENEKNKKEIDVLVCEIKDSKILEENIKSHAIRISEFEERFGKDMQNRKKVAVETKNQEKVSKKNKMRDEELFKLLKDSCDEINVIQAERNKHTNHTSTRSTKTISYFDPTIQELRQKVMMIEEEMLKRGIIIKKVDNKRRRMNLLDPCLEKETENLDELERKCKTIKFY